MENQDFQLTALSPLDGRYNDACKGLQPYFSEYALIRYRLRIEIEWLQALAKESKIEELSLEGNAKPSWGFLSELWKNFSIQDAREIKKIEAETKHDVKALEIWIRTQFTQRSTFAKHKEKLAKLSEFIHFACTSEDINNLAYALMIKESQQKIIQPTLTKLIKKLITLAEAYAENPMISRTHGQPASPTTMGKEIANVAYRLQRQAKQLEDIKILGKINGAVGNFNAHLFVYPNINWVTLAKDFVTRELELNYNPMTTQIEPHDYIAELCDVLSRINTILIDLNRDIWSYISLTYFKQKINAEEVGSSTMPHKVNPIDFENSEGNLGLANALLNHFSAKLPISRLQRDLTDSTVLRNLGIAFGYSLLAWQSCLKGLNKLELNQEKLSEDIKEAWELLAEPIQMTMRRFGYADAYNLLKKHTRGKTTNREELHKLIRSLDKIPEEERQRLLDLTPEKYIGYASNLVKIKTFLKRMP